MFCLATARAKTSSTPSTLWPWVLTLPKQKAKQQQKKSSINMAQKDGEYKPKKKSKSGGSKKPLTGFMLFSKEHRPKVKEDNPDITFGQIGKKLGEMWRELSDEEKQAYKDGKSGAKADKE